MSSVILRNGGLGLEQGTWPPVANKEGGVSGKNTATLTALRARHPVASNLKAKEGERGVSSRRSDQDVRLKSKWEEAVVGSGRVSSCGSTSALEGEDGVRRAGSASGIQWEASPLCLAVHSDWQPFYGREPGRHYSRT